MVCITVDDTCFLTEVRAGNQRSMYITRVQSEMRQCPEKV